jgi:hypothetical protein|tara:strand:+ start:363 stop:527 length:165 start_codon:yes stop_codon:yes gene_type:complete
MTTVADVAAKQAVYEAVSEARWLEILHRIKRLELAIIASAGAVILLMAGLLWKI